jgi:hypothetical protein
MELVIKNFKAATSHAKGGYMRLASADIYLPELEMTLFDVTLTWSMKSGFSVLPPFARLVHSDAFAIYWNRSGIFVRSLAGRLVEMLEEELGEAFNPVRHAA